MPAGEPLRLQEVAGLQLGAEPRGRDRHRPLLASCTRSRRKDEKTKLEIFRSTSAIGAGQELQDRIRWVMDDPRPRFAIAGHDTGLVIGAGAQDRLRRQLLAHLPVPDAQPCAGAGRLSGRRLSRPVLGAGRRRQLLDLHLQLAARPAVHQFRAREVCQGLQPACRGRRHYVPVRNIRNDYMLDRAKQKTESFTGIMGVSEQDAAIQDSQGPIQDRTREHLGPTDIGIVEFRKLRHGRGARPAAGRCGRNRHALRSNMPCVPAAGSPVRTRTSLTVMTERFGHRHGYVGNEYGLAELS